MRICLLSGQKAELAVVGVRAAGGCESVHWASGPHLGCRTPEVLGQQARSRADARWHSGAFLLSALPDTMSLLLTAGSFLCFISEEQRLGERPGAVVRSSVAGSLPITVPRVWPYTKPSVFCRAPVRWSCCDRNMGMGGRVAGGGGQRLEARAKLDGKSGMARGTRPGHPSTDMT